MSTIIIGSGIIGLTTAIRVLESQPGKQVHIIASRLPTDEDITKDPEYASACAGAHHLSFAADEDQRQARWDRKTFEVMQAELITEGEKATGLMSLRQTEYFTGDEKHLKFLEGYPDFEITPPHLLPPFSTHSISFRSLTMTPSTYLLRLTRRFLELGGKIHRGRLISLEPLEIVFPDREQEHGSSIGGSAEKTTTTTTNTIEPLSLFRILGIDNLDNLETLENLNLNLNLNLILCIGIGAHNLPGLPQAERSKVFPTTGQVVRVRAPWVRTGWTRQVGSLNGGGGGGGGTTKDKREDNKEDNKEGNKEREAAREGGEGGQRTYIIPRGNGEVILGGTRDIDLWDPTPNPSTTEDILHRCLSIYPSFLSGHPTTPLPASAPMAEKMEVLRGLVEDVIVGYRPSREGGPRVERGSNIENELGLDADRDNDMRGAKERQIDNNHTTNRAKVKCKVFYNYGHGGAGWQACWGAAEETRDLVLAAEGI